MTWEVMGLRQKVQRDLMESALPDDLKAEFHDLSQWAHTLPENFGRRVNVRLVDAASIEGFLQVPPRRVGRYPAFIVKGERYVGPGFSQVDALITTHLTGEPERSVRNVRVDDSGFHDRTVHWGEEIG